MFEIPSRDDLDALSTDAAAIGPVSALGFSTPASDGSVSILYVYEHGLGGFSVPANDVLDALRPDSEGRLRADHAMLESRRGHATEVFLLDIRTQQLVSVALPGVASARFWIALTSSDRLTSEQYGRIEGLAQQAARAFSRQPSPEEQLQRLGRLEQAAELIPALLHVLDVREVIDRLSATAQARIAARSPAAESLQRGSVRPSRLRAADQARASAWCGRISYPPRRMQAWTFSIVDDHTRTRWSGIAGDEDWRSFSLRFPIRFDDRVIGGVAFVSFRAARVHGQRCARRHGVWRITWRRRISHFMLAERLAEQARRTEELRAQATNLELLDELLGRAHRFGRRAGASSTASRRSPRKCCHTTRALPDGSAARRHAGPAVCEQRSSHRRFRDHRCCPQELLDPDWEHDLFDDMTAMPARRIASAARESGIPDRSCACRSGLDGQIRGSADFSFEDAARVQAARRARRRGVSRIGWR